MFVRRRRSSALSRRSVDCRFFVELFAPLRAALSRVPANLTNSCLVFLQLETEFGHPAPSRRMHCVCVSPILEVSPSCTLCSTNPLCYAWSFDSGQRR